MRCHHPIARGALVALFCVTACRLAGQDNPGWWGNYGIVTAAIPSAGNATLYNAWVAQNYLPANLGQLKNFAAQAQAYLDTALASVGGAGPDIGNIVANFTVSSPSNFAPVNFGQIKAVATPIYDRLYAVGFSANVGLSANYGLTGLTGWNATFHYPWPAPPDSGDTGNYNAWVTKNYLPANLGQLKSVFSFDLGNFTPDANLSIAGDGIPDWWKTLNGLDPFGGNLAGNTDFGDGRTDLQEYQFYFNVYNGTVGGSGNVSGFQTAYTTESTTFPAVPANYTTSSLVFPRQPVPQYAVVDLGAANMTPIDLNNNGQVLLGDYYGDYALWSGGTLYDLPTTDGDYTYYWLTLAEDGTVMGAYSDTTDPGGFARWTMDDGASRLSFMAAGEEFVSGNFTAAGEIEDSYILMHGAIYQGVSLTETKAFSTENQNSLPDGMGDCISDSPTPIYYNNFYSMMLCYNSDGTVTQFGNIVFSGKDGDYSTGNTFAIAYNVATTPQGDALAVQFTGNYATADSDPVYYTSGYDDDCNPITSNFTYTVRYPDDTTFASNLYLNGVLLPEPDPDFEEFIWPPIAPINAGIYLLGLANTTTGPVLVDPYRYDEETPYSVDSVSGGSLVQANLTAGGSVEMPRTLNALGLGTGGTVGGELWLNGALLPAQTFLPEADFNADLTLNVSALGLGGNLGANTTLSITNVGTQTALAAGYVEDGAGNFDSVLLVPAALAVDNNRDGNISFDVDDATSSDRPFRFWLNDDVDRTSTVDATLTFNGYVLDDDLNPANYTGNLDYEQDQIPCTRDLEDFSTLAIDTSSLQQAYSGNSSIYIGFKWKGVTLPLLNGHPAIKLYWADNMDDPDGTGGLNDYLTNSTTAASELSAANGFVNDDSSEGAIKDISGVAITANSTIVPVSADKANGTLLAETANGNYDFVLPASVFQYVTPDNPIVYLHFEGCQRGQGQLEMVILQGDGTGNFTKIADGPNIYFDFKDIKEMYERWSVGDGPSSNSWASLITGAGGGGPPGPLHISQDRLPAGVSTGFQYPSLNIDEQIANTPYILFVHGWNCAPWVKDAFAETAYKRLYWQGYQGRFGAFQWPTTYHSAAYVPDWADEFVDGPSALLDFDPGELSALQSGTPFLSLLSQLRNTYRSTTSGKPPNIYVFAHSHGNVVVGEALRLFGQLTNYKPVNTYIATQAALVGSVWDGNLTSTSPFSFNLTYANTTANFGPQTANVYDNLFAPPGNATGVTTKANFYNVNDYAFSTIVWQADQALKPDFAANAPTVYFYGSSNLTANLTVARSSYLATNLTATYIASPTVLYPAAAELIINNYTSYPVSNTTLQWGNTTTTSGSGIPTAHINDQYQIMAFAAEPRSTPLGATSVAINGFSSTNLGQDFSNPGDVSDIWPADPFSPGDYSEHPWHSAEFRFDNMQQNGYWHTLLGPDGFNLLPP